MSKNDDYVVSQVEGIGACVKKVEVKKTNGVEWMLLEAPCACKYSGETKVYYCRSKQVYFAVHPDDENQLELNFREGPK
jgi:hypothetical protein